MFRLFILISVLVCAYGEKLPLLEGRIVGGEIASIQQFPHEVSVEYEKEHICGGSIISETVILTAAHCMNGRAAKDIRIHAGITRKSGKGVRIAVKKIIVHEDYDATYQDNDVSLLILAEPLHFTDSIKAVPLAESNLADNVGSIAYVSGWGLLNELGMSPGPDNLRSVAVKIIDSKKCRKHYEKMGFRIHESMICAGTDEGGKDACMEDSGSPLTSDGKLIGVVSWGIGCANKDYPGVYARVSYLRDWIEKNMRNK